MCFIKSTVPCVSACVCGVAVDKVLRQEIQTLAAEEQKAQAQKCQIQYVYKNIYLIYKASSLKRACFVELLYEKQ